MTKEALLMFGPNNLSSNLLLDEWHLRLMFGLVESDGIEWNVMG